MFTNADLLPTLLKVIDKTETVKIIVYDGEADHKTIEELKNVREGMKVLTLDEVVEIGKKNPVEAIQAKREDVYCCMYTSGSSKFASSSAAIEGVRAHPDLQPVRRRVCF